MNHNWNFYY